MSTVNKVLFNIAKTALVEKDFSTAQVLFIFSKGHNGKEIKRNSNLARKLAAVKPRGYIK
jgi:hypothetical protein